MEKSQETLAEAEERFSAIRHEVYRITEETLNEILPINVRFSSITLDATEIADSWVYPEHKQYHAPGWSWAKEARKFKRRPRRVEAAIWVDQPETILCGLVLGRVGKGRMMASIHFLEGNPNVASPLKGQIAQIAIRHLELHAYALGCNTLGIANPRPDLIKFYEALGFRHYIRKGAKVVRLERRVDTQTN
jgi:hypothetical protein